MDSAATAAMAFMIVPRHVLGSPGHTPSSEKLNVAGIGVGGQGGKDLKELDSEISIIPKPMRLSTGGKIAIKTIMVMPITR